MAGDVPVWPDNMALMTVKGGCLHTLQMDCQGDQKAESFWNICFRAEWDKDKNLFIPKKVVQDM